MSCNDVLLTDLKEPRANNMDVRFTIPLREAILINRPGMATVPEHGQAIMNRTYTQYQGQEFDR